MSSVTFRRVNAFSRVAILSDAIGDRDIPDASAKQLVDVRFPIHKSVLLCR